MKKTIFRTLSLVLLLFILAACDSAEQAAEPPAATEPAPETEAPAPTETAVPEPTAIPDAAENAAVPAADPAPAPVELLLQFQDSEFGPLSSLSLDLSGLEPAPEGKTYAVWLVDDSGQYALLAAAAAGQTFTFKDPDGRNLLGLYAGAALSLEAPANVAAGGLAEPTNLVSSGAIPSNLVSLIRQLAVLAPDTPDGIGYNPGLNGQAEHAATHSQLALDGIAQGDHAIAKIHLEHVNNILVGNQSPDFGDLTGDGDPQNPGDGYGVNQYAFQVAVAAGTIAEPNAPDHIRETAAGIVTCAANISDIWGPESVNLVREGINAADAAAAEGPGLALKRTTNAIFSGVDADDSGAIDIAKDECGATQIHQLSRQLYSIPMTVIGAVQAVVDGPPAPTAPPAGSGGSAPVTISMLDFEFDAAQVTVPAGTSVTWTNDGQAPHSATAVDGSFDTGLYDGGESESITFDTPGTFAYYCELHGTPDGTGGMVGTLVVEP